MRRSALSTLLVLVAYGTACTGTENPTVPELTASPSAQASRQARGQNQNGQHDDNLVPFTAHYSQAATFTATATCPLWLTVHGVGDGTPIGPFTVDFTFCNRSGVLTEGSGSFVAANGDRLYFTFFGTGGPAGFTSYATITGGTGRFAGATGTATVTGAGGVANWAGVISLPQHGANDEH